MATGPRRQTPRSWQYQRSVNPIFPFVSFSWYQPLATPERLQTKEKRIELAAAPFFFYPYTPIIEIITLDKWWRPLSEPVRIPPRLNAASNPSFFWNTQTPGEIIIYPKWGYPWSEPVRFKRDPRANIALMASGAFFPVNPNPETVFMDSWWQPMSTRLYSLPGLLTANQSTNHYVDPTPTLPQPYSFGTIII